MKLQYQPKVILITVFILFGLLGCATSSKQPSQSNNDENQLTSLPTSYDKQAELYQNILLGRIAAGQQQYHQALNYYLLALKTETDIELAKEALMISEQINDHESSLFIVKKWLEKDPNDVIVWQFYGSLLIASGDNKNAITWYYKALEKFPESDELRYKFGHLLYDVDQFPEAIKQFQIIVNNNPKDNDSKYMLGACYYSVNNYPMSRNYFIPLLEIPRHRNPVLFYLGEMARKNSDINSAINFYQQIEESRYYPTAHSLVARLLQEQGKSQQAIEYLSKLKASDKDSQIDFRYMSALIAADMNDIERAETDLRYILSVESEHVQAMNALGYTLADANIKLPEARQLIEDAYKINPESSAIVDSMGWIRYRQGELVEALEFLQQAYKLEASAEIAAHLGEVFWVMEQQEHAIEILSIGLKSSPENKTIKSTIERFNIPINELNTES